MVGIVVKRAHNIYHVRFNPGLVFDQKKFQSILFKNGNFTSQKIKENDFIPINFYNDWWVWVSICFGKFPFDFILYFVCILIKKYKWLFIFFFHLHFSFNLRIDLRIFLKKIIRRDKWESWNERLHWNGISGRKPSHTKLICDRIQTLM